LARSVRLAPDRARTAARLCDKRRRRRSYGSAGPARSVAADLAGAYRQLLDDHGPAAAAKAKIALVSNQPGDRVLIESVAAAAEWVRAQAGAAQRAALLAAMPAECADVVRLLSDAVGSRLKSPEFCDLVAALDLSQTGALDRAALARAVRVGAHQLIVAHGPAGAGKTTALRQVADNLPGGSALVLFDCYGGGDCLSSGEERHTPSGSLPR